MPRGYAGAGGCKCAGALIPCIRRFGEARARKPLRRVFRGSAESKYRRRPGDRAFPVAAIESTAAGKAIGFLIQNN
jgi:hypothetical protein